MTLIRQMLFSPANISAFETLETAELTPIFQGDFVFGLNVQMWQTPVASGTGASVDTDSARLRIQSGTNASGSAYILNAVPLRYRAGQGTLVRMTPIYTSGVANNIQLWGVGAVSAGTPYDGYFFGYNGTSFGICHYVRGTPTWTAQASWNGETLGFTLDPTKGYPMMIKYPYLGFGDIFFYIQSPETGRFKLAHVIRYAGTVATTQLSNPTMYIMGFTKNSGNTSNVTMYNGSVGAFISGTRSLVGNPRWSAKNNKSSITTETNILALRNATTYNGVANRGLIRLQSISVSSSAANGIATFDLILQPTLGDSPTYTPINGTSADSGVTITSGNSITSYDTAGTTITGGYRLFSITVDNPNSSIIDLSDYDLVIAPGQILSIAGYSSSTSQLATSINFSEDI